MREIISILPCTQSEVDSLPPNTTFLVHGTFGYWLGQGSGNTENINDATVFTRNWNIIAEQGPSEITRIHLFREVDGAQPELPPQPPPRAKIEHLFSRTVLELLRVAPLNPIARAHAMNELRQAIPDNCKTFEEIKEWAETSIAPRPPSPPTTDRTRPNPHFENVPVALPRRRPDEAFHIEVEVSNSVTGRCRYSCDEFGGGPISVGVDELNVVAEESETLNELVEKLTELIDERARVNIELSDSDNYDYTDHESNDGDGLNVEYPENRLRGLVRDFLLNHNPDRLRELEGEV